MLMWLTLKLQQSPQVFEEYDQKLFFRSRDSDKKPSAPNKMQ
jgi:hypothetical protein